MSDGIGGIADLLGFRQFTDKGMDCSQVRSITRKRRLIVNGLDQIRGYTNAFRNPCVRLPSILGPPVSSYSKDSDLALSVVKDAFKSQEFAQSLDHRTGGRVVQHGIEGTTHSTVRT